jgi:formylglycine-generating enzyme required for sulfatase activity
VFLKETRRTWKRQDKEKQNPAVDVSREDGRAFCVWLTERERKAGNIGGGETYRLPFDHEWSCAAGFGEKEDPNADPEFKAKNNPGVKFIWGDAWPPPAGWANLAGEECITSSDSKSAIPGYRDECVELAPVGKFKPTALGLFDLIGNAAEWCEDNGGRYSTGRERAVLRGTNFRNYFRDFAHLNYRMIRAGDDLHDTYGFRCMLAPVAQ